MKLKKPTIRSFVPPDDFPGIVSVISRDGKTYTEKAWCGCVAVGTLVNGHPDWTSARTTAFCGTPHPDTRSEPGYPRFIPTPKKFKIKKGKR